MPVSYPPIPADSEFESIVAEVFRKAGWRFTVIQRPEISARI